MATIDYKETELWQRAKALLTETYRLTQGWPEDGKDLANDIRCTVRQIVRSVPNAFQKGGITGNVHLQMSKDHFAELEALCEAAEALHFVERKSLEPLVELLGPISSEFAGLAKASRERARELMKERTSLFRSGLVDDDDES